MDFRGIVESLPLPVLIADSSGEILFANAKGNILLEELGGRLFPLLCDGEHECEAIVRDRGGVERVFHVDSSCVDCDGARARLMIVKDITEIKTHERKAIFTREQILKADKMDALSTLVSGVAHQINNPNNIVGLNAGILKKLFEELRVFLEIRFKEKGDFAVGKMQYSRIREKIPELLDATEECSGRIGRTIDELRDYVRETSSEDKNPVDICETVASAVSLMSTMVSKVTNNFVFLRSNRELVVVCNPQRLQHVVISLLQNACRALTEPSERIEVRLGVSPTGSNAEIVIQDEGCGMSVETKEHARDPFFTIRPQNGNLGMGLSICDAIVSEHGGRMTVDSVEGEGTTVRVILPLCS